ncbi:MAG TPA: 50S ribosomal protein L18 [Clostridiales bacterium]|nr:MAG: 50S ribosomal protein L18 [Clostridiales bacterium GWD2_32_19]HCC07395.1 50S ribosomal protein L18 [Clostridiales bacterium]
MSKKLSRSEARADKHARIRNKIRGTEERPRLCVFKSLHHISAQIINDETGNTIASASTQEKEIAGKLKNTANIEAAKLIGEVLAKRAMEKGIKVVVFDRSGYIYHGKVKMLADGAREVGLDF